MVFLRQEARLVERFRIIEVAQQESVTEAARWLRRPPLPRDTVQDGAEAYPAGQPWRRVTRGALH